MANDVSERPSFFEGMYLGASDLRALLDYLRGLIHCGVRWIA